MDSEVNKRDYRITDFVLSTMKFAFGVAAIVVSFMYEMTWFTKISWMCVFIICSYLLFKSQVKQKREISRKYLAARGGGIPLNRHKRKKLERWQRKNRR